MSFGVECPRCGSWRCEWTDDELFCPCCLLHEGPEDFKFREENPFEEIDLENLEFVEILEHEREKEDQLTERYNEQILRHQSIEEMKEELSEENEP